jgi:hypothetical protein
VNDSLAAHFLVPSTHRLPRPCPMRNDSSSETFMALLFAACVLIAVVLLAA